MTHARVAIVIVTFNSAPEIGRCLDALKGLEDTDSGTEIVVVDNASSDGTRREVEQRDVRLIQNVSNAGFAAAVNQGVRATQAPLVLLLNPDARIVQGLDALSDRFRDERTGAAGGLLISNDGSPQTGFLVRRLPTPPALIFEVLGINRLWPRNPVNWNYRCLGVDPMVGQQVEQPAGAFLMFRRRAWEMLGGFDEGFWPVWFEDVDFCARLRMAGWNVCYEPHSVAFHDGGHSIRRVTVEKRQHYWYVSLLRYAGKHFRPASYKAVCLAVAAGAIGRAITGFPRGRLKNLAVYRRVCSLALGHFFCRRAN